MTITISYQNAKNEDKVKLIKSDVVSKEFITALNRNSESGNKLAEKLAGLIIRRKLPMSGTIEIKTSNRVVLSTVQEVYDIYSAELVFRSLSDNSNKGNKAVDKYAEFSFEDETEEVVEQSAE